VVRAYQQDAAGLAHQACSSADGSFLEDLSGLSEFRAQAAARLEEIDVEGWDDDAEDGHGDEA
jgi:hypothetical protein